MRSAFTAETKEREEPAFRAGSRKHFLKRSGEELTLFGENHRSRHKASFRTILPFLGTPSPKTIRKRGALSAPVLPGTLIAELVATVWHTGRTGCRSAAASAMYEMVSKKQRSCARSGRLERLVRRLWRCSLCNVFDEFENEHKRKSVIERVPREVPVLF